MKKSYFTISLLIFLLAALLPTSAQALIEKRGDVSREREVEKEYDNSDVRRLVEEEFGEDHVMVDVARCESSFRQFDSDDDPLVNSIGATGVFQILQRVHEEIAEDFGYDIYTLEGNIGYAAELYEADGLKPWSASSLCWDDGSIDEANPNRSRVDEERSGLLRKRVEQRRSELGIDDDEDERSYPEVISKRLIIGVEDPEVQRLQELLNDIGYRLAASGPGSPGEETDFFGTLTKQALQKFQCAEDIICSGSEYTTGYGMADASTRAALNEAAATGITSGRVRQRGEIQTSTADDTATESKETSSLQEQIRQLQIQIEQLRAQLN